MTSFPASTRTYVNGANHRSVRVPFREIALHDNSSFRVYDTQGPWGDPEIECDVHMGLSPLREAWVLERGDSIEYEGRRVRPEDNGFLSSRHADQSQGRHHLELFPGIRRKPRKAANGGAVTQLHYARKGIVTPEMEFIAIRENLGRERASEAHREDRTHLQFQHGGEPFGAKIPE